MTLCKTLFREMRQAEPVEVQGGAESAEHQVGTADKVVHSNIAAYSVRGINHLCSLAPGSKDSSREEQSVKPTAALDLPPLTLGCTKTASQHGRDASPLILRCTWTICWLRSLIRDTVIEMMLPMVLNPGPSNRTCSLSIGISP